jgi:DNA polymerase-1
MLMLIDGSHALFRAYFAIRHLTSPSGQPTGAVYGFVAMLLKLMREHKPDHVAVCFDTSGPTFRHELDPTYKANRPDMPEDLAAQWPVAERLAEELGVPVLLKPGLEADDLIAALATRAAHAGWDVEVVSGDKDLMQLVCVRDGERGAICQRDDGKGILYTPVEVEKKWGLPPERIGDLLAIMGDSVDNVPGVRGIGEKGALKLLLEFGSLDGIYQQLDQVTPPRLQQLLRDGRDDAYRSRRVVALHTDAEIPWAFGDLCPKQPDRQVLAHSFAELGFKRLLAEYLDEAPQQARQVRTRVVATPAEAAEVTRAIRAAGRVALAVATSAVDPERVRPMLGSVVGVALAWQPDEAVYLPVGHQDLLTPQLRWPELCAALGDTLADAAVAKVGHHLKYDAIVLQRHGVVLAGWAGDVQLASYLHEPERYAHSLRNIAYGMLNTPYPQDEEVLGRGKAQQVWPQVAVAQAATHWGTRAGLCLTLAGVLEPKLAEVQVDELYRELELPLAQVLATMEASGVAVDVAELGRQSAWLAEQAAVEEAAVHGLAGHSFAIGSPQQLGQVLFEELALPAKKKTQTGWSTDQTVLEALAEHHPIAERVLRWRQLSKLKSTYTDALPLQIDAHTGRVHTAWQQAVAATGRLSSTEPNLQNIPVRTPEGRRIRQAFVAAPGCVLMSADYSQIELRVMAHLARDPGFLAAFRQGLDIHRETAALVFGVDKAEVTAAQRSAAKAVVFGILYGMGPQRLGREIGVPLKEAKAFIGRYFERFPGVHAFVEQTLAAARQSGEVRTLFGRRRPVPGLGSSSQMERAAAERIAVNTPVQGTAADLIKRAMLAVDRGLREGGLSARLILQVHDELVLEVPTAEIGPVATLVRAAMLGAAELAVPLQVDLRTGHSWAEAH